MPPLRRLRFLFRNRARMRAPQPSRPAGPVCHNSGVIAFDARDLTPVLRKTARPSFTAIISALWQAWKRVPILKRNPGAVCQIHSRVTKCRPASRSSFGIACRTAPRYLDLLEQRRFKRLRSDGEVDCARRKRLHEFARVLLFKQLPLAEDRRRRAHILRRSRPRRFPARRWAARCPRG